MSIVGMIVRSSPGGLHPYLLRIVATSACTIVKVASVPPTTRVHAAISSRACGTATHHLPLLRRYPGEPPAGPPWRPADDVRSDHGLPGECFPRQPTGIGSWPGTACEPRRSVGEVGGCVAYLRELPARGVSFQY